MGASLYKERNGYRGMYYDLFINRGVFCVDIVRYLRSNSVVSQTFLPATAVIFSHSGILDCEWITDWHSFLAPRHAKAMSG